MSGRSNFPYPYMSNPNPVTMKRIILLSLAIFTCIGLNATVVRDAAVSSLAASKPNIILVMTDDQGMGDLSCMGNEVVRTPHIDRFHDKAVRFTDFQVSPTCAPTRAALMSGRVPFKNGVTHTIFQRERMALDTYTFPQALQSAGYATGLFGKWHLGDEEAYLPGSRGFDEVLMHGAGGIGQTRYGDFPPNIENLYFDNVLLHNETIVQTQGFCTDLFFDAGLAWIKSQLDADQPYFAYISLNAPHAPLVAPKQYTERFRKLGYDKGTAGRYGMVENIDDNFGKMLAKLEEWDALENTLVIFMTDNGATHLSGKLNGKKLKHFNAHLKGGKNSPDEGGTHVPAFWQWRGVLDENVDVEALTAHIDLYPTFVELAGADLPADVQALDGRSLLPLLENPHADWPDRELFVHCGRWNPGKMDAAQYAKCAVRTERWRLVNNKELYDIAADPYQENDVAQSYPEVVEQLSKSYDQWWVSVQPFLINEGLPKLSPEEFPFYIRYHEQLKESGIPDWAPASY